MTQITCSLCGEPFFVQNKEDNCPNCNQRHIVEDSECYVLIRFRFGEKGKAKRMIGGYHVDGRKPTANLMN